MQAQQKSQSIIEKAYVLLVIVPFGVFMGALALDGWIKKQRARKNDKAGQ